MNDLRGFADALKADPTDQTVRLIMADWVEDQGTPGCSSYAEDLRHKVIGAAAVRMWLRITSLTHRELNSCIDTVRAVAMVSSLAVAAIFTAGVQ